MGGAVQDWKRSNGMLEDSRMEPESKSMSSYFERMPSQNWRFMVVLTETNLNLREWNVWKKTMKKRNVGKVEVYSL